MNISNLLFFDKKGESYNLSWNSDGYWEGADYFLPVSTEIFDNSNIFILERVTDNSGTRYKFPQMEPGSKFDIVWKTADAKKTFFLFTISLDGTGPDAINYINYQNSITVNYSDFGQENQNLDLSYPFQINVAFNPAEERSYSRVMQLYYTNDSGTNLVMEMTFYGEGEGEDERFRVWLENFGIKFNREDALLLKDYDLKESLSDWIQLNQARKQLLVNQDQVYPYVGTYKGMLNLINLLGYRDVLRVKEYWRDTDPNSSYYRKFAMVDVTDLMQLGDINKVNLIDENGGLKSSKKFKKTEFLALAYEFTVATDNYDDDGLPEVVETTEFTVDEMFFKLHGIAKKLETEILPVNVIIRDIIGEFIYFNKFNLRNWIDETTIEDFQINDVYRVKILEPNATALELKIRDIKTLYPKLNGVSQFPSLTYNNGPIEPYQNDQQYSLGEIPVLISAISDYYADLIDYEYRNGDTNPADYGDDVSTKIGCPIVMEAYIPDLTLQDLDGVTFNDFITSSPTTSSTSNSISTGSKTFSVVDSTSLQVDSRIKFYVTGDNSQYMEGIITAINGTSIDVNITEAVGSAVNNTSWTIYLIDIHHTIANLKYRNGYEIEWIVRGPQEYFFKRREKLADYVKTAHILPHTGNYSITANIYDMQGGVSFDRLTVIVKSEEPVLQIFTKIQDKSKYDIRSLQNVTIADLGQSPLFDPFTNGLNPNGLNQPATQVKSQYLNWYSYTTSWGVGTTMGSAKIFNPGEGFQPYPSSTNPKKKYWGTGSVNGQPTIGDYSMSTIGELYHQDFSDMSYVGDSVSGFYIDIRSLNSQTPNAYIHSVQYGGFPPINLETEVPNVTLESLRSYLATTTSPGWADYTYSIVNNRILAAAKLQTKTNHSIITTLHTATVYDSILQVSYPIDEVGLSISDIEINESTLYTFTEIFESPTVNDTSGLTIGTRVRVVNQLGGYIDGVITELANDHFNVQAQSANQIGDFTLFDVYWLDSTYTFEKPKNAFDSNTLSKVQSLLSTADFALDEDLLFLYSPFEDKLREISSYTPAKASSIKYWINKGYVTYDTLPESIYSGAKQIDFGISEDPAYQILDLSSSNDAWQHRSNDPNGWTPSQNFVIKLNDMASAWKDNKKVTLIFDSPIYLDNYTITVVTDSQDISNQGEYGIEIISLSSLDFPMVDGVPSRLAIEITCTNADNFVFSVDKISPVQRGYLPSYYDENSLTFANIKTTYDTLIIPPYHPIFAVISNLASNVETEWTLTDINDKLIIQVQSPSYFVWRFDEIGSYKLMVKTTDTRNNTSYLTTNIAVASVVRPKEYSELTEQALNDRKRILADS